MIGEMEGVECVGVWAGEGVLTDGSYARSSDKFVFLFAEHGIDGVTDLMSVTRLMH